VKEERRKVVFIPPLPPRFSLPRYYSLFSLVSSFLRSKFSLAMHSHLITLYERTRKPFLQLEAASC
jgi:hypothetical protein